MADIFESIDFTGTIQDYDFTRQAVRGIIGTVSAEQFGDMDAGMIAQYLTRHMRAVPFGEQLKRYIYMKSGMKGAFSSTGDDVYLDILKESFRENMAPFSLTPTTKKAAATFRLWLKQESVRRPVAFLLGFGLRMPPEDVSMFLTKIMQQQDFDFTDRDECVYWYCFKNQLRYATALELLSGYPHPADGANGLAAPLTPVDGFGSREELLTHLARLSADALAGGHKEAAIRRFRLLLNESKGLIAAMYMQDPAGAGKPVAYSGESITTGDIEAVICSGVPLNEKGRLSKASLSVLAPYFHQYRLTRARMDDVLKGRLEVDRYDLVTLLFFIFSQEHIDDVPENRCRLFISQANVMLGECHMSGLYPVNPYEAFILMCLLSDTPLAVFSDVWEISYGPM